MDCLPRLRTPNDEIRISLLTVIAHKTDLVPGADWCAL